MHPFHRLFRRLLSADHRRLAGMVAFLKAENRILRARITGEVHTRPQERFVLLRHGRTLGPAVQDLLSIVGYRSYLRWVRTDGREVVSRTWCAGLIRSHHSQAG